MYHFCFQSWNVSDFTNKTGFIFLQIILVPPMHVAPPQPPMQPGVPPPPPGLAMMPQPGAVPMNIPGQGTISQQPVSLPPQVPMQPAPAMPTQSGIPPQVAMATPLMPPGSMVAPGMMMPGGGQPGWFSSIRTLLYWSNLFSVVLKNVWFWEIVAILYKFNITILK